MKSFFCSKDLYKISSAKMLRLFCFITRHGSMDIKTQLHEKNEAFEMWTFRRMLLGLIKFQNETILERMGRERELLTIMKRRKTAYFRHILRKENYQLLHLIIKGRIEGRRGPGRRQLFWIKNIRHCTGMGVQTVIRIAEAGKAFGRVILLLIFHRKGHWKKIVLFDAEYIAIAKSTQFSQ